MAGGASVRHGPALAPRLASRAPGIVHIDDGRIGDDPLTYVLEDEFAAAYVSCFDRARKASEVASDLVTQGYEMSTHDVTSVLHGYCERRLMVRDGNLFLALALPATPNR